MIIKLEKNRAEEAARFAYLQNKKTEHRCKAFPESYEAILSSFLKMIEHEEDEVLFYEGEKKEIEGLLSLCVEKKDRYIEAVGGVFAKQNYQKIAFEFLAYLKKEYKGFCFDAVYPIENKEARTFMEKAGARLLADEEEYVLKKELWLKEKEEKTEKKIQVITPSKYEAFIRFHDEREKNVYWTGKRLIEALESFEVLLLQSETGAIIGTTVTSRLKKDREEIYFFNMDGDYQEGRKLLEKAAEHAFLFGAKEVMLLIEANKKELGKCLTEIGFQKKDTALTYEMNL